MLDVAQIARLEGLSEDDLMSLLGREVLSKGVGADQASDEEKVEVGKNFFAEHRAELKRRLCGSGFRAQFSKERYGKMELYAAIADAVSTMFTGIALAVVAVLIVREGLDGLCKNSS